MSIETISARWDCKSDKSDTYRLLNIIHSMAGRAANHDKKSDWKLRTTCTNNKYVLTEWTNGIVDICAETHKDYDGSPILHVYKLREARE